MEFNRRGFYKDYLIYLFHLKYNHSSGRVPLSSKSFFFFSLIFIRCVSSCHFTLFSFFNFIIPKVFLYFIYTSYLHSVIGPLIWSLLSGYDVKWWRVIKQWALCLFKVMLNWKHNWHNRIWHGCQLLLQWMSEAASDSWQLWVTARNVTVQNVAARVSSYTGNVFSWTTVSCGFVWLKLEGGERNGLRNKTAHLRFCCN